MPYTIMKVWPIAKNYVPKYAKYNINSQKMSKDLKDICPSVREFAKSVYTKSVTATTDDSTDVPNLTRVVSPNNRYESQS